MSDVVIVGSGLFGSMAAEMALNKGHAVTVISNYEPMAASKASGCVLAPSWLSSLSDMQIKQGLHLLDELYGLIDCEFTGQLGLKFKAQRVDPDKIIRKADVMGTVESVGNGQVTLTSGVKFKGKVLVAAGIWSDKLVPMPKMKGLYGCSVRFQAQLPLPRINVYAPYRQAVGFQLNKKEVWFGDGTALIRKTWEGERASRVQATVDRGLKMLGTTGTRHKVNEGARPYVEGNKSGYFQRTPPQYLGLDWRCEERNDSGRPASAAVHSGGEAVSDLTEKSLWGLTVAAKGQVYQHHSGRMYQVHEVVTCGTKVNGQWDYEPLIVYHLVSEPMKRYARFEHDFLSSMTRAS